MAFAPPEIVPKSGFGGRVWLLPRWYYYANSRDHENALIIVEFMRRLLQRPSMYRAAEIMGPIRVRSGVRWTLRKGFVGRLTFDTLDQDTLQYADFWPPNLMAMGRADWKALVPEVRDGCTLQDAKNLKALYGSAVGASLRHPVHGHPIGCIVLHTCADEPLNDVQATQCMEHVSTQAGRLSQTLAAEARLR